MDNEVGVGQIKKVKFMEELSLENRLLELRVECNIEMGGDLIFGDKKPLRKII